MRNVRPQQRAERGEMKKPWFAFFQHAPGDEHTQQACKRQTVRPGRFCKCLAAHRARSQQVCKAKRVGNRDDLGDHVARDHPAQRCVVIRGQVGHRPLLHSDPPNGQATF